MRDMARLKLIRDDLKVLKNSVEEYLRIGDYQQVFFLEKRVAELKKLERREEMSFDRPQTKINWDDNSYHTSRESCNIGLSPIIVASSCCGDL